MAVGTTTSCGSAPPDFTCNVSVVPGATGCGKTAWTTTSPILSSVSPELPGPRTTA